MGLDYRLIRLLQFVSVCWDVEIVYRYHTTTSVQLESIRVQEINSMGLDYRLIRLLQFVSVRWDFGLVTWGLCTTTTVPCSYSRASEFAVRAYAR
jgi:hypothetical protein